MRIATTRSAQDVATRTWDCVVVGTGIGGGTIGYALAKAGKSVLFCERGRSYTDDTQAVIGEWPKTPVHGEPGGAEYLARAGRLAEPLMDVTERKPRPLRPVVGIGTGGSSAIYGMVMERFFPADFTPGRYFRDTPGINVPDEWPISFTELAPYYTAAEQLYGVKATPDPLRLGGEARGIAPPPAFSAATRELADVLAANGLHPYHVPVACEHVPDCQECVGFLCAKQCKRDSVRTCLIPAVRDFGAELLTNCDVWSLEANGGRVTGVNAVVHGEKTTVRARTIVLAAGALHTPAILLRSGGTSGLANASDQVGRNLMRHFIDYYLVRTHADPYAGLQKQLALNDFYVVDGLKLGTMQSNGPFPPASVLAASYRDTLRNIWPPLGLLFPMLRPLIESRAEHARAGCYSIVSFCEDLPYAANRISLSANQRQLRLEYRISTHDAKRLDQFRTRIARAFKPLPVRRVYRAELNQMLAHVCGTCRFGDDPKTSVLDRNNRAHDLDNLYIVDASFFPTSTGTNPSLTIAANALRVAEVLS